MVFSSLTFLFLFLPLVMTLYYLLPWRGYRNMVLLIFSLVFYAWGEPVYIVLMLLSSLAAWLGGLGMEACTGRKGLRKAIFWATVALITGNLLVFKYLNFFCGNLSVLLGMELQVPQLRLPIGISFYTFQILSYVVDLYWGKIGLQKNYLNLTLYVSFFPQLIAGPIVRYQTVEDEIHNRRESWADTVAGLKRFILGLAKKVLLANNIALVGNIVYAGDPDVYGTLFYWLAAIAYALQIYFDFSGYSDMAIGLGRMFGFHFLENFSHPYIATSITDFWRRWHISLSTWFRDYIYIPLGGSRTTRGKHIRNILIVWALTGFWHGASWNFILWGMYYGALLLVEKFLLQKVLDRLPKALRWVYAMVLVLIGWVIFSLTDFVSIRNALGMMLSFRPTDFMGVVAADSGILTALAYLIPGLLFMLPVKQYLPKVKINGVVEILGYWLLLAVCIVYILSSSYNPFIYFRF